MTGIIVCGGTIRDYACLRKYFYKADLVICADGGAYHLRNLNIVPDILVGDFDSIAPADRAALTAAGVETIKYPVRKDMTDSHLAVDVAVERGCNKVLILGGTGTRLDHSTANLFLLKTIMDAGAEGIIADEYNEAMLINNRISLKREDWAKVTLLPLTERVDGVTTSGLYYPLENATIKFGSTWGVSNEFTDDTAEVSITGGLLLVIKSKEPA